MQPQSPVSLYETAKGHVMSLLCTLCRGIELRCGGLDDARCRQCVERLREHVLCHVPAVVLDELRSEAMAAARRAGVRDLRVVLWLLMHGRTMVLTVVPDVPDHAFWLRSVSTLHHLVRLQLGGHACDRMLAVVAASCPQLQEVYIDDRADPFVDAYQGSWLRDQLLTPAGLLSLCQCKQLHTISMDVDRCCAMRVPVDAVRALLSALARLQYLSSDCMGRALALAVADGPRQLALTYLCEHRPRSRHVQAAARLCPALRHVALFFDDGERARETLRALADTQLAVAVLEVCVYPVTQALFRFLARRGHLVTELRLQTSCPCTHSTLVSVGRACPNLVALRIKADYPSAGGHGHGHGHGHCPRPLFLKLQTLVLVGFLCDPATVLGLCVSGASHLGMLVLAPYEDYPWDTVLCQALHRPALRHLHTLRLEDCFHLSLSTVLAFLNACPRLACLQLRGTHTYGLRDIRQMLQRKPDGGNFVFH